MLRSDHAEPAQCPIMPALYMTLQGAKSATFGKKRYDFGAGQALVVTVHLPSHGMITIASPAEPYLGLVMALDRAIMQETIEETGMHLQAASKTKARGSFVLRLNRQLVDCALRAVRLLETPEAISTLYPGIMREVCYWLLMGPGGDQINHIMMMANGHDRRIIQAIHDLRDRFRETIHVKDLALAAHMSPATFHRRFKSVTAMAPQQYQQQLRLHEARRLMIFRNATVETAASEVGYSSVSQFSREYTRMFGRSPRRDVSTWRGSQAAAKDFTS
jgi:AraC-like DNA-binding protein